MKILIYGAGVLGCNPARNLLRAGKDDFACVTKGRNTHSFTINLTVL